MANVLIAGCGDVGIALGCRLTEIGHRVWGLRRNPQHLPKEIHGLQADLSQPATLVRFPAEIHFVFVIITADRFEDAAYHRSYVRGTYHLMAALQSQKQNPERIVFVSSTSVYGQTNGDWVDEESLTQPNHFSGKQMLQAEQVIQEAPYPTINLRSAGIYGPKRIRRIGKIRRGEETLADGPPRFVNLIHRDDLVGILYHVMTMDDPKSVYIAVDHQPVDQNDLIRWLAHRLGKDTPGIAGNGMPNRRNRSNKRCRNNRILSTGYEFQYPTFQEGYAKLVRKEQGEDR